MKTFACFCLVLACYVSMALLTLDSRISRFFMNAIQQLFSFLLLTLLLGGGQLFASSKRVDKFVNKVLEAQQIQPAELCSDEVFLRRVSLVLTGKLPTVEQVIVFLASENPQKRALLVDEILASEAYVDYQVLKWGDLLRIKSEFPSNIWPNGVQAYNRWLREQIRSNAPYNQMVYEMLVSTGSNFRSPAVNFYRAFQKREPALIAENVNLLFLGSRKTPATFAAFFTQLCYKSTREWKEEIVYIDLDTPPDQKEITMPDGVKLSIEAGADYRKAFAQWLCLSGNRDFARAMTNRVWFWLMGRGIIDPPDDIRPDNPASNPALLESLTTAFIDSGYDIRALMRLILNSDTFARSSVSSKTAGKKPELAAQLFAQYPTTRMTAEQIIDAIGDITGIFDIYISKVPEPYSYFPHDIRAVQIGDGSVSSAQIEMFGRPSRDVSLESDRDNRLTSKQVLYLLNSAVILKKIEDSEQITSMAKKSTSAQELTDRIYLMMLARHPSAEESASITKLLPFDKQATKLNFARKLVWALLNSSEFLFNH